MKKVFMGGLLLALTVGLSGCGGGGKPKDLIIGKWEVDAKDIPKELAGMKPTIEFKTDGTTVMTAGPMTMGGKYKFVSEDDVEVEMSFAGITKKEKNKVKVTADELTTTDEKGKVEKYKKVK